MNISKINKLFKVSNRLKLYQCCSVKSSPEFGISANNTETKSTSNEGASEYEEVFGIPIDVSTFHKSASDKIYDTSGVVEKYNEYFNPPDVKRSLTDQVFELPFGYMRLDAHNASPKSRQDFSKTFKPNITKDHVSNVGVIGTDSRNFANTSEQSPSQNGTLLASNELVDTSEARKTRMEVSKVVDFKPESNQFFMNPTPGSNQQKLAGSFNSEANVIDNQYFNMSNLNANSGAVELKASNYYEPSRTIRTNETDITRTTEEKVLESVACDSNVIENQYFDLSLSELSNTVSSSDTGIGNSLYNTTGGDLDTNRNIIEEQYFNSQNNLVKQPEFSMASPQGEDDKFSLQNNFETNQEIFNALDSVSISIESNDCALPMKNDKSPVSFSAMDTPSIEQNFHNQLNYGKAFEKKSTTSTAPRKPYQKFNNEGNFTKQTIISTSGASNEVPADLNNIGTTPVQFQSYQGGKEPKNELSDEFAKGDETGPKSTNEKTNNLSNNASSGDKLDSKGFRIVKSEVPKLYNMLNSEVLSLLQKSIIYDNHDIIALNKPFGLISQGGESTTRAKSLNTFLKDLSLIMSKNSVSPVNLHLTHRLDKDTTGVLLLAKTERMAVKLQELFAEQKIKKTYLTLVRGVPSPSEGLIDIPICEGSIGKNYRMVLSPQIEYQSGSISRFGSSKAQRSVTYYKVLHSNLGTSLLEVKPLNGLKHQIRVHLGFGLACPIVGDHKYTYLDKIVPQKLSGDTLDALGIRQSKVRDLPLHLHALQVTIPELVDGRNITISAALPGFFSKTLKALKYRNIK